MASTGAISSKILEDAAKYEFRGWRLEDRDKVVPLIKAYLEEACPDMLPTDENGESFFNSAGEQSVLVIHIKTDEVVGFSLLCPINHVQTRVRMIHAVGTYVLPSFRRRGLAEQLRRMSLIKARHAGFKLIQGFTYNAENTRGVEKLGAKVVGLVVECKLGD